MGNVFDDIQVKPKGNVFDIETKTPELVGPPAPQTQRIPVNDPGPYTSGDEFQALLQEAKQVGVENLPEPKRSQVMAAIKGGKVNQADLAGQQAPPAVQDTLAALGELGQEIVSKGDPENVQKFAPGFLESLDQAFSKAMQMPGGEAAGQAMNEMFSTKLAMNGFNLMPDTIPTGNSLGEIGRASENLVKGAIRLVPELMVGLYQNPHEFVKGFIEFPVHEVNLIMQAAIGWKVEGGRPVEITADQIKKARAEIANNPLGIAMLGMMGLGAAKGMKPSEFTTVELKQFQELQKQAKAGEKVEAPKTETPPVTMGEEAVGKEVPQLTPEAAIEATAEAAGVKFTGYQEFGSQKRINLHDPETGGDYLVKTADEIPDYVKKKRADFAQGKIDREARESAEAAKTTPVVPESITADVFKGIPIRDNNGNPIVVIDATKVGKKAAGYFTDNKDVAERFASVLTKPGSSRVVRAKVSFDRPFIIDAQGKPAKEFMVDALDPKNNNPELVKAIQSGDYDGVIIRNTSDEGTVYLPKSPNQITSVVPESGTPKVDFPESKVPETVYHGSSADNITQFFTEQGETGSNTGATNTALGAYFSESPEIATTAAFGFSPLGAFSGKPLSLYDVKLNLRNPLDLDALTASQLAEIEKAFPGFKKEYAKAGADKMPLLRFFAKARDAGPKQENFATFGKRLGLTDEMIEQQFKDRSGTEFDLWQKTQDESLKANRTSVGKDRLKGLGYDGVILKTMADSGDKLGPQRQFVVFDKENIAITKKRSIADMSDESGTPAGKQPVDIKKVYDDLEKDKSVFWHGTPSGDLRGGKNGLHIGTREAARQALNSRIGLPALGEWDGTRKYGETLLAGRRTMEKRGYSATGHNVGPDIPMDDYYPSSRKSVPKYGDGSEISMDATPDIFPVKINGKMSNTKGTPHQDFKANGYMSAQIKKGNAKSGYYYENVGEDSGSISAVVPNESHISRIVERSSSAPDLASKYSKGGKGETPVGTKAMAQRLVNAEDSFVDFAMENADLTREQAVTALEAYKKAKAIKIDIVGGKFQFTHGSFAEKDVLRKAAGITETKGKGPAFPDQFTEGHFKKWADNGLDGYENADFIEQKIRELVAEDPKLLERDWPSLRDMVIRNIEEKFPGYELPNKTKVEGLPRPEPVDTGFKEADLARNLAHTRGFIKSLEKRIADKDGTPEQLKRFQEQLAEERQVEQDLASKMNTPAPGAVELGSDLNVQPEAKAGGIGYVPPSVVDNAKAELPTPPEAATTVKQGIKNWFALKLGTEREQLAAGTSEVGLGKGAGEQSFDVMRRAKEKVALLKRQADEAAAGELGNLLLKETDRFTKPGMSQSDVQFIQSRLRSQINKAVKKRDIETLKAIAGELDSKMFNTARGIKGLDANGNPVFGTKQRAGVYKEGEAIPEGLIRGEKIEEGPHRGKYQYYRPITAAEGQARYDALPPEAQKYVVDYVKRREDLAKKANIDETLEGYVPSIYDGPATKFKGLGRWFRLKKAVAPERQYRTGILTERGEELQSLVEAEKKMVVDLGSEAIHNEAAAKLLTLSGRVIKAGEIVPEGWSLVETKSAKQIKQVLDIIGENQLELPLTKEDLSSAAEFGVLAEGKRIIVPNILAKDLGGILNQKTGTVTLNPTIAALLEMGDEAAGMALNNANATLLLRPKTTMLNFVSGEMQFTTKVLEDFYSGVQTGDMTAFKSSMKSYVSSLSKTAREGIPEEMLGEGYYKQFQGKGNLPGYNQLLAGMKVVETVQKRRTYDAVIRTEAKKIAGGDAAIEKHLIENPTTEMYTAAWLEMDRVNFDYNNLPTWLQAVRQSRVGRAIVPFPAYMYKAARLNLRLLNPENLWSFGDKLTQAEKVARRSKLATATTLGVTGYLLTKGMGKEETDQKFNTEGRVPVGEYNGKRIWVDIKQLPFVREAGLARQLYEGKFDYILKYGESVLGTGPGMEVVDVIRGVRDEYDTYTPAGTRLGKIAAEVSPYAPLLSYFRKIDDPIKRKSSKPDANLVENFFYGFASEYPGLSKTLDAKVDRKTKDPLKYNETEVKVSFWTPFNIKLVDEDDYRAFLAGQAIGQLEAMKRAKEIGQVGRNQQRIEEILKQLEDMDKQGK